MQNQAQGVTTKEAMHLISLVEGRAELAHLQIKKYRNFLTIFSCQGRSIRRHARLALSEDGSWQVHLPAAPGEWTATQLTGTFGAMTHLLVSDHGDALGRGPSELRASLALEGLASARSRSRAEVSCGG